MAQPAQAASSKACENGGYALFSGSSTGTPVIRATDREVTRTIPAATLGATFRVQGRYNQFVVRASDFALFDYAFTGAPNRLDMTGGRLTPVWESKVPDHRGLSLSSPITVELEDEDLVISRTGTGLSMKIQAKDCAQGGIFQMEPERGDGTRTPHPAHASAPERRSSSTTRTSAPASGSSSGPAAPASRPGPPGQFCVRVATRVNIGNDVSPAFVARDSAQVADRVPQPECTPLRSTRDIEHCGRVSVWDVASGGRMGFVTGEDAVEVANPPTECVAGLPGAEPGPRSARRPRPSVPGPGGEPPGAGLRDAVPADHGAVTRR